MHNLFQPLPGSLPEELVTVLAENQYVRIERIVSMGHASPEGFWYDQAEHEWIALVRGQAKLSFQGDVLPIDLKPGDCLLIEAHRKHRVESTTATEPTIWLAVFYRD